MRNYKICSIAIILLLLGTGFSLTVSGVLLELSEAAGLDGSVANDLNKSLTIVNRFYCGGSIYGDSLVGVSFSFLSGDEQPLTRDGIKDTTRDFASRSVAIPFLRQLSRAHGLSEIINLYFLPYSLKNLLISVSSTELIRVVSKDNWVGTIVIVKDKNMTVQPDGLLKGFVDYYIKRLDRLVETEPLQNTANIVDYIDTNAEALEIDEASIWKVMLYGSAVNIHLDNRERAAAMIGRLADSAGEIFFARAFRDTEFLLAGDIFIITGDRDRAYRYWGYGMQMNPLNEALEKRFSNHDR